MCGVLSCLVQVLPSEEGLVAGHGLEQRGEGVGLLALLPVPAAAVALQRVVDDAVVVRVLSRQDAGSAGAAQRAGDELWREDGGQGERWSRASSYSH